MKSEWSMFDQIELSIRFVQSPGKLTFQFWQAVDDCMPNGTCIYAEVMVDEFVTHTRDLAPRHLLVTRTKFSRKVFCCFTQDLNLSNHGILNDRCCQEA